VPLQQAAAKGNHAIPSVVVKYVHATAIAIRMVANADVNAVNKLYLVEPFGSTFFKTLNTIKMKKYTLYALILLMAFSWFPNLKASTNVKLKFNHKIGSVNYAKNLQVKNNLDHDYTITRLEYYISNVIIIHDGGSMDTLKNTYFLMNPSGATETLDLGLRSVTNIEAIQFSIGVDPFNNHANPASFMAGHPLAPKSPSMHWGWTSGYRFLAIEGKSGSSLNQTYQLHGLWDANYYSLRIPVTAIDDNGAKVIELNADYDKVLHDISINSGVIAHGDNTSDRKALQNMRDSVFTNTNGQGDILSIKAIDKSKTILTYPNPAQLNAQINLTVNSTEQVYYKVINLKGAVIKQTLLGTTKLFIDKPGMYTIQAFTAANTLVAMKRQIVL
jgi:hypothetical protein